MDTRADIANESNRKLYQNHLSSLAKLREARLRIAELEEALRLADAALSGANMNMKVVEKKVRAALGEQNREPPPEV